MFTSQGGGIMLYEWRYKEMHTEKELKRRGLLVEWKVMGFSFLTKRGSRLFVGITTVFWGGQRERRICCCL